MAVKDAATEHEFESISVDSGLTPSHYIEDVYTPRASKSVCPLIHILEPKSPAPNLVGRI